MKQELSQEALDTVLPGSEPGREGIADVSQFDFGRADRIPKSQLRALHLLHENFVRALASSLSASLRSYVGLNLASLEQISYSEFLESLAPPTCTAYLGLAPYDGTAVLASSTALMLSLVELLLGSKGRSAPAVSRKVTEIEKNLIHTLLRIVLRDLSEAWKTVAEISFALQSLESEPQLLHVISPAEAVVAITIEVKVGTNSGFLSLAIPSLFIKRMRDKFDQLQRVRRVESTDRDQQCLARLLQDASLTFEARLNAGSIAARTLLDLEIGDVLVLDQPIGHSVDGLLNGREKWIGNLVSCQDKFVFEVSALNPPKPTER